MTDERKEIKTAEFLFAIQNFSRKTVAIVTMWAWELEAICHW